MLLIILEEQYIIQINQKLFVDKNLKIIGLKNFYISSSSIFPTSGSANPTATILALSLRLSKFLKNQK